MMVCSFTGHRQIKYSHLGEISGLVGRAIEYAYSKGCREFIAGGAIGFDTVAAREVVKFRMTHRDARLILFLPCLEQDSKWTARQKALYEYLLSEADEVVYVSEEYTDGCMKQRNFQLAAKADILISYVSRNNSGAAQTVRMARENGVEIYNLYPALEAESKGE
ncbi:MAG: DUF1273 domain-containing protein [Ruminococcaceae bacterium]|nr:DUF1273 domain-containing protein [Oscillospiraceae bacterium]